MVWLGIVAGMLIGGAFDSFNAALFLSILGGILGRAWSRREARLTEAITAEVATQFQSLESAVKTLQAQLLQVNRRMAALERGLPEATGSAEPPPVDVEVVVDGEPVLAEATVGAPQAPPAIVEATSPPVVVALPEPAVALSVAEDDSAQTTLPALVATPESAPEAPPVPPQAAAPVEAPEPEAWHVRTVVIPVPEEPSWLQTFVQRWVLGGNPIVKIGVLILFLGLAFLLRYAAEHAVLPIELRYVGVAATGIALLLAGWRWRNRLDNYGLMLQGAGIGVLYLTTLAAMKLHPLLPLGFGFGVLIAVAAFAALLAVLQDALALAVIGTLGGFAAPVLTSTGGGDPVALFSYLTLLNVGIVAIAWFKAWRVLNLIGFIGSITLGSAWAERHYRDELFSVTEPFLLLLFLMYVLVTFLFARRTLAESNDGGDAPFDQQLRRAARRVSYVDGSLAFGVPFSTFGLQYLLVKSWDYAAAFSALGFGLVYLVLALLLFGRTGRRYLLLTETLLALGVIFGSLAIPLGLEQAWTSAAWAVEAAGVYWVGIRQQRLHARLFALLLLIGSSIAFALGLHRGDGATVLDGSVLGCVLLALSTCWTYGLMRRADADQVDDDRFDVNRFDASILHSFEQALRPWIVASAAFFVALLPFLLWPMDWASPALAVLGTAAIWLALRLDERPLLAWGWLYQALAGALFMTTLQTAGGGSVLANGWGGLVGVSLLGASMLAGVWAIARQLRETDDENARPALSGGASVALLAGLVFVNLAPLFVLPWRLAALIWPLTGIATLWWAARARHVGAVLLALLLQAIAGAVYFGSRPFSMIPLADPDSTPFLHSGFGGPLLIALAALICARLLHRQRSSVESATAPPLESGLGWIALYWSLAWWGLAWSSEIRRLLAPDDFAPCLIGLAAVTAWASSNLARRWQWPQLGVLTLWYLPILALIASDAPGTSHDHPLAGWGALAWPAALAMHLMLLRRQIVWLPPVLLSLAHIAGAWLFLVLAGWEGRWQLAHWTTPGTAWPLLGWMLAPVAYLWAMSSDRLAQRWPVSDHPDAYRLVSAIPVVLYLLGWVWVVNGGSDGSAAPLPYLPVLNPLELAQLAVWLGAALWWSSLREHAALSGIRPLAIGVAFATAFAMLTGSVVRACHHWGQIPWHAPTLFAAQEVQAALSIVWSIVAIGMMLLGHRRQRRWVWIVGAGLIAVVVAKLFLVELSASGSLARIVSFIVVGLLLLLVGYFAPLPPRQTGDEEDAA